MKLPVFFLAAALVPATASAEVPQWLSGAWQTHARLTAPDGARLRIRCTLDADATAGNAWDGTLECATVQGRFAGQWQIALSGDAAFGTVSFTGPQSANLDINGTVSDTRLGLAANDGQGVIFSPGASGALIVEMQALGPQRLTGALTFEPR